MTALVIFNASAGSKRPLGNSISAGELGALLSGSGIDCEVVETSTADDPARLAADAVRQRRGLVVAAGGDGTVASVCNELLGSDTALGILPLGSVMNIARSLGIPHDLDDAVRILAQGVVRRIDVGEANGRPFYEAASVGLNATIFSAADHFVEGDYRSTRQLLWVALRYRPPRVELLLDDERLSMRALMVVVSNGPYTGAGMTVAPSARLDDGQLDVTCFRNFSKFELVRHLVGISFGRRRYTPHVRTYRASMVRVESRRRLPVRVDGVDLGSTPLECRARRAALRVVVPGGRE